MAPRRTEGLAWLGLLRSVHALDIGVAADPGRSQARLDHPGDDQRQRGTIARLPIVGSGSSLTHRLPARNGPRSVPREVLLTRHPPSRPRISLWQVGERRKQDCRIATLVTERQRATPAGPPMPATTRLGMSAR